MTEKDLMPQEIEARVLQVIVLQVQMSKENLPALERFSDRKIMVYFYSLNERNVIVCTIERCGHVLIQALPPVCKLFVVHKSNNHLRVK